MTIPVTVGICAFNEAERIHRLLGSLLIQLPSKPFEVAEILVVASGCTDGTERIVERWTEWEPRITLIREAERHGKSSAMNLILGRSRGDILVFVNADARLQPGALDRLLEPFRDGDGVDIACGFPVPEDSHEGLHGPVQQFLWSIHNRTLETLSKLNLENHCCDELMAMRRGFVENLPGDLINDGAYLGVVASLRGRTVRFCPGARVTIETPRSLSGLVQQRRRILLGHRQIKKILHHRANTLEGMMVTRPQVPLRILYEEFSQRPRNLAILLLALPLEVWSNLLALVDDLRTKEYQPAWRVVE